MKAFCISNKCAGISTRPVEKFGVPFYKIECPDCKHILRWAKTRESLRNISTKGSRVKPTIVEVL